MSKSKTEKVLARRVYFPLWKDIVAFSVLSAIAIIVVILSYIYDFEPFYKALPWLFELLFIILFLVDFIPHKTSNDQGPVAITTDGEFLIVYQKNTKLYIDADAVFDMDYKNKKSYIVTPYYYSEKVYNYGKFKLYILDGNRIKKIVLHNILDPDRAIDKIASFLGWDEILSEEDSLDYDLSDDELLLDESDGDK